MGCCHSTDERGRGDKTDGQHKACLSLPVVIVGPKGEGEKLERQDSKEKSRRQYMEVDGLLDVFRNGDIALLRGSWLLRRAGYESDPFNQSWHADAILRFMNLRKYNATQLLPYRQQLEAEDPAAYLPFEELVEMCQKAKEDDSLPVVAVSYCWEGAAHPDPAGRLLLELGKQLRKLCDVTGPLSELKYGDVGIFLDWASVFQKPRTPAQENSFRNGLRGMNVVYAHYLTVPLIIDNQDAFLEHPRSARGWPFFEEAMSFLLKDRDRVLGGKQGAPMPSAEFESKLQAMNFTNGADRAMVAGLYKHGLKEAYNGRFDLQRNDLQFGGTGGRLEDLGRCLREVEPVSLECVDLKLYKGGKETLGEDLFAGLAHCPKLRSLCLRGYMQDIPDGIVLLSALEELSLLSCECIKKLPSRIGELAKLKKLYLDWCEDLEELPESVRRLSALEGLSLRGCKSLKMLPESIGQLQQLKDLDMERCSSIEELPDGIMNLRALEKLDLEDCDGLKKLPTRIGQLTRLRTLNLSRCNGVEDVPASIWNLTSLTSLDLSGWDLQELPDGIVNLSALEQLRLLSCWSLTKLPTRIGQLTQLKTLELSSCKGLKEMPEGVGRLSALETLDLSSCTGLKKLPEHVGQLPRLKKLVMCCCSSIEEIPEAVANIQTLKELDLRRCPAGRGFKNPRPEHLKIRQ